MYKNGSLPVVLSEEEIAVLLVDAKAGLELEIDLPNQVVRRMNGEEFKFEVEEFRKYCLVNGLDDISLTLKHDAAITAFEKGRSVNRPWLDGIGYAGKIPLYVSFSQFTRIFKLTSCLSSIFAEVDLLKRWIGKAIFLSFLPLSHSISLSLLILYCEIHFLLHLKQIMFRWVLLRDDGRKENTRKHWWNNQ